MLPGIALVIALAVSAWTSATLLAADAPAPSVKRAAPVALGDAAPVALGDAAPDFTLEDQDGQKVNLTTEWKTRPVVLIFYRGNW